MRSIESLYKSYLKQKEQFEAARTTRINNRDQQVQEITLKIAALQKHRDRLIQQNREEKDFQSFDSFRLQSEEKSKIAKSQERPI